MKIAVAGTGYVGLSLACLLAQHNDVVAVDVVPEDVYKRQGINLLGIILTAMGKGVYTEQGAIAYGVYLPALALLLLLLAHGVRTSFDGRYAAFSMSALLMCLCCWPMQNSMAIVYRMAMDFIPVIYAVSLRGQASCQANRASGFALLFRLAALCYPIYRIASFASNGIQYCGNYNFIV